MGKILVRDIAFRFSGAKDPLFSSLNLAIESGERVALSGPSGIGKTTLIYLLAGLLPFEDGEIEVDGFCYSSQTDQAISGFRDRALGVIFQEYNLLRDLSVEENLMLRLAIFGLSRERGYLMERLDRVGMADHLKRRVGSLSGGQQQRVALVRALITQPRVILADEPTGNLDDRSAEYIVDELMRGGDHTVLLASHDARMLCRADRCIDFAGICQS